MGMGYVKLVLQQDPDFEAAMQWAFGSGWKMRTVGSLPELWNSAHGELFVLYGHTPIDESMEQILELYKKIRSFEVGLEMDECQQGESE